MSTRIDAREAVSFRLFVAAGTLNSALAIANLSALCKNRLPGRYQIELVDVFAEPQRTLAEGIFMTPTLVKLAPGPARRCVGTLGDEASVLLALGLNPGEETP